MTDFTELRRANSTRVQRWHGPDSEPWTGSDWSNAMCGEAGETANVVKKLRRAETNARNEGDPEYDRTSVCVNRNPASRSVGDGADGHTYRETLRAASDVEADNG